MQKIKRQVTTRLSMFNSGLSFCIKNLNLKMVTVLHIAKLEIKLPLISEFHTYKARQTIYTQRKICNIINDPLNHTEPKLFLIGGDFKISNTILLLKIRSVINKEQSTKVIQKCQTFRHPRTATLCIYIKNSLKLYFCYRTYSNDIASMRLPKT